MTNQEIFDILADNEEKLFYAWSRDFNNKELKEAHEIWSNGEELAATLIDDNDLGNIFTRCDLEKQGFWKAMVFEGGYRVEA